MSIPEERLISARNALPKEEPKSKTVEI
jgi:hypothetical protein